jgi:hypothetical protein
VKQIWQLATGAIALLLLVSPARAQNIQRFAANFLMFDGAEVDALDTNTTSNPILFYDRTIKVPASVNLLYVTIFGTTDTHTGARELINCQADGVDCNNTGKASSNGSPAGWVTIAHAATDLHDVAASYGWCVPIKKKKSHKITLRLASDGTGEVFMEQIHVFVDGSKLKNPTLACQDGDILPDN